MIRRNGFAVLSGTVIISADIIFLKKDERLRSIQALSIRPFFVYEIHVVNYTVKGFLPGAMKFSIYCWRVSLLTSVLYFAAIPAASSASFRRIGSGSSTSTAVPKLSRKP